ncbi:MAG: glycosyl hydrolase family 18 protein [Bacillota bacterium]|nr:glycosyl hydrolase family 18 protein [Bacillota bacterium]
MRICGRASRAGLVLLLAAAVLLGAGCAGGRTAQKVPGPSQPGNRTGRPATSATLPSEHGKPLSRHTGPLKVLAFYDDQYEKPRGQVLTLVRQNRDLISYLAPFWYKVQADGSLIDNSEADLKKFARENRILLQPLFTNAGGNDAVLLDPAARARAVENIVAAVQKNGYAGASIDFQLLKPESRDGLSAFVAALSQRLHAMGKVVTVDVIPALTANGPRSAYDYAALGKSADQVVLMTYDRHSDGSPPGSVAPLAWVDAAVREAISVIPPDRVILGLAAYGYDWPQGSTQARSIPLKNIPRGPHIQRTPAAVPYYTYVAADGTRHEVWFEDDKSIVKKIQIAKKYGLHGLAVWRVGYETAGFWNAIRRNR